MATKVKWTHVYEDVPEGDETIRTYVGFFVERKDAEQWVKKHKDRKLELSDKRPVLPERVARAPRDDDTADTTTKDTTAAAVDEALTTAIAAAKAEEAPHAVPPAGKTD